MCIIIIIHKFTFISFAILIIIMKKYIYNNNNK